MIYRYSIISILMLLVLFDSACKSDDRQVLDCDDGIVISDFQYSNAEGALFEINDIQVDGDLLTVNISSGGCSGSSWSLCLLDSGAVLESFPPQRLIRFVLNNEESCLAYIQKPFTFDISILQTDGNIVILQVADYPESVEYTY